MLGWRGRFGYISPSTIQVPWEIQDMLPEGVGVVATVLSVRAHSDGEFAKAQQGIEAAIEVLLGEEAKAVYLGGVPVAVRQGYRGDLENHERWSERFGVPIITSMGASVEALRHLGARHPIVATAYLESINQLIGNYLAEAGLEAAGVGGLAVRNPNEASRVEPYMYYRLARELVEANPRADAIFLGARGNIREAAALLEEDLGIPVVYGSQSGLWWALRQMGVGAQVDGCGRLLNG